MTAPSDQDHALAQRLLAQALDELRREALRVGRVELFEQLLPDLLGQRRDESASHAVEHTQEHRLALTRLGARLRERVNAQLRLIEPDPVRRRALRQRLQAVGKPRRESP